MSETSASPPGGGTVGETAAEEPAAVTFPLWPLLATLGVQTLATMAAYTVPALAPAIARDLGVDGSWSGYFVAMVYGVGVISSLLAPVFIHARGAVRASQAVLLATIAMLLVGSLGTLSAVALSAVALGLAYGATAPSSVHLLVPLTPPGIFNLVMSLRQIGVPLGGVLAAITMPPLALSIGWRQAMLMQLVPVLVLLALIELPRKRWDGVRRRAPALSAAETQRASERSRLCSDGNTAGRLAIGVLVFIAAELAVLLLAQIAGWPSLPLQPLALAALLAALASPRLAGAATDLARGLGLDRLTALLRDDPRIAPLVVMAFVYSGMQLCFVAFMTSHLTSAAGFSLVAAGQALATYQLAGAISRPIWGWIADRFVPARRLLVLQGLVMAASAAAAGQIGTAWSTGQVLGLCVVAGTTASGYTGIAYAEFARIAGARRTEATGLASASMFAGVMLLPSLGSLIVSLTGGYGVAYPVVGLLAGLTGLLLALWR